MKPSLRHSMAGLMGIAIVLLAACGGGGGGSGGGSAPKPTAVASADADSVAIGTRITLDASGSSTPNEGDLNYQWSLSSTPLDSTAALSDATSENPWFTPDLPGDYVADLVVSDGTASGSARVTITATNPDPLAIIRPLEQTVYLGSEVTLDGSHSLPPTGLDAAELTYQWILTEQPEGDEEGSIATELEDPAQAQARFFADKIGIYRATLSVRHGDRISAPVETVITVNAGNSHPVIKIEEPEGSSYDSQGRLLMPGTLHQQVVLDGSGSSDPDGDALGYRWRFPTDASLPQGAMASIEDAGSARASFVPDVVGSYPVDFSVYDNHVAVTQRVIVQVTKAEGDTSNAAPVAASSREGNPECELGGSSTYWPYCSISGSYSYDPDGDPLTYAWVYWNEAQPDNRLTSSDSTVYIDASAVGIWHYQLTVNDGQEDSATTSGTMTIKIAANRKPVAKTTMEVSKVLAGETLTFDGSESSDADGDRLEYIWTLVERPDGSDAKVQQDGGIHDSSAYVVTDKPGRYSVFLEVRDSRGAVSNRLGTTTTTDGFAKLTNNPPILTNFTLQQEKTGYYNSTDVGGDLNSESAPGQAVIPNDIFRPGILGYLTDPDQDAPLYYAITVTRQPEGSNLPSYSCAVGEVGWYACHPQDIDSRELIPGEYEYEAIASDGVAYSDTKKLVFNVVADRADYPSLLLERLPSDVYTSERQVFFPFRATNQTRNDGVMPVAPGEESTPLVVDSFRLTAYDRDYTITDLNVASAMEEFRPAFVGLRNGQVIKQGESVEFSLTRPPITDEASLYAALQEVIDEYGYDEEYRAELARLSKLVSAYQFTWVFRVEEREGYSFRRGPLN
ncbi:putative lipoprotein [Alcanivorax xiamenensis]|uniref:Lipoprotein n=1 Tax=Alcanivorax xiamenensis TaxID=1177156 RepID=A0ABQ6YB33_9GAMM|nr:PKD domain-containing protein [Alcanivorax xiamenensis]KAF0807145.1 putative lipoprotein [Alcanivorax xiamenensis]